MKPNRSNNWILTEIELSLCARMLGNETWNAIPVFQREYPLERRMLEGVFRLTEMGLLLPAEGQRLQPSPILWERMRCVVWPERMVELVGSDSTSWRFFRKGAETAFVEPVLTEPEGYRLMTVEQTEVELLWEQLHQRSEFETEGNEETTALEALLAGARALVTVWEADKAEERVLRISEQEGRLWMKEANRPSIPLRQTALEQWVNGKEVEM